MLGNLLLGDNLLANVGDGDEIFTGLVWVDICPPVTLWEDESADLIITRPCEESL